MKKGFTLIELLIVMVIVTILVTIAVPMYKTSMEKGRAVEAMANAAAVSEAMNAFYIRNGNSYYTTSEDELREFVLGNTTDGGVAGITTSRYFDVPDVAVPSAQQANVTMNRSTGTYSITFVNTNGQTTSRSCSGNTKYCKAIGL